MAEQEGLTVKKSQNFSEWYTQIIEKAELADTRYNVQGFIVHRPWAMMIFKKMYELFEKELEKTGHKPVLFPLVIPEENLKKEKEHFDFVPEVFWVTETGLGEKLEKKLALRPTSETAMYPMYSLWIRSYRDLPLKLYQSNSVYRYEPVTRPFLRGREFLWIEAHDAFESHEEALSQVKKDVESSKTVIFEKLGIPLLFFKRPKWDKFLGADDTYAADTLLPDGKALQISSTHDLGQRFSIPFNVKFIDKKEEEKFVWQTCYGPGIWRIFAALVSIHGDDKGLVLPFDIAPVQIIIIPIFYSENDRKEVMDKVKKLKNNLDKDYRVELDDGWKTPGQKYNHWELFGVPIRLEIGQKEVKSEFVTAYRRDTGEKEKIKDKELGKYLEKISVGILENLKKKAKEYFESDLNSPKNRNDFFKALNKGGFVIVNFCGREECAKEIQNQTGAKVRGTPFEGKTKPIGKCINCNKDSKEIVYIAKQY